MVKYQYSLEYNFEYQKPKANDLLFGDNVPDDMEILSSFKDGLYDYDDLNIYADGKSIHITNIKTLKIVKKIKNEMGKTAGVKIILHKNKLPDLNYKPGK